MTHFLYLLTRENSSQWFQNIVLKLPMFVFEIADIHVSDRIFGKTAVKIFCPIDQLLSHPLDLLQTSNRTIATCLYSLPSLLKGRFINHPSIMSNGIWGNLLLKKRWYFWQLYIVDIHSWPCICVHVLLNNISAWCCSMLAWCGEREMNVGWDQIGGMYGIYHFIFLHAFSTQYCNPCCI